ncbi:alpha/beta fold hydrolase [bacterium]|nr:alpha/beta fold hydrolase [bacterium]
MEPTMTHRFAVAPFVAFFGGFGSCFVDGHPSEIRSSHAIQEFIQNVSDAAAGESIPAIKACYAIGNDPVYSGRYHHKNQTHTEVGSSDLETLFDWIERESAGRPLILVGQSHGGWTAMKAALHMKRHVEVLATADPISVEECDATAFSASTLGYATLGFKPWPGCTRAPLDLKPRFAEIRAKSGVWHNFYQTETTFLRSSAIPEASTNELLTYTGWTMNPIRGHAYTESDRRVWSKILDAARALTHGRGSF